MKNRRLIYIGMIVLAVLIWIIKPSNVEIIPAETIKPHSYAWDIDSLNAESLEHLIKIIKIPTVRKDENKVAEYLAGVLKKEGIVAKLITHPDQKDKVTLIAEIGPTESSEGIILLGHTDVVETSDEWMYPPFEPKLVDGRLYGRGTLDMKGMVILEMMTLIQLHRLKFPLKNKIMFMATPDEESGGQYGAKYVLENFPDLFKGYKYVINEGGFGIKNFPARDKNFFNVQFAEKGLLAFAVTAHGDHGHASMPTQNYSTLQLMKFINQLLRDFNQVKIVPQVMPFFYELSDGFQFPNSFFLKRMDNPVFKRFVIGKLTERNTINAMLKNTISVTGLSTPEGGVNMIPHSASATLDMRLLPGENVEEIFQTIKGLGRSEKIEVEKINTSNPTESSTDTKFFKTIKSILQQIPNTHVAPYLSPGATDNRFFREKGFVCYGLIPFVITLEEVSLLHGTNEYVKIENLNLGQQILMDLMIQMNL